MSWCCQQNSVEIGTHSTYGAAYRCRICGQYWHFESDRLWEESEKPKNVPVYWGPGEFGLANAIALGLSINFDILTSEIANHGTPMASDDQK